MALLGAAIYIAAHASFVSLQDEDLAKQTATLKKEYAEGGRPDLLAAIVKHARSPANSFRYGLYVDGRAIASDIDAPAQPPGVRDFVYRDARGARDDARGVTTRLPDGSLLLVAVDSGGLERLDAVIITLFSLALGVILMLGLVGAILLGRHLARRLDRISATAEAIAGGDLSHRLDVPSGSLDEFDRVGASLNAMLDRITGLLEELRQVSNDLAHDLRTPLARLRSEIESGLTAPSDAPSLRATLERAQAQSDSLLSLFGAILSLAEVSAGGRQFDFVEIELGALAREVCEMHAPAIEDSGRSLHVSMSQEALTIRCEPALIRQAISNLLDNALIHTPAGTTIRLVVQPAEHQARIIVEDDGPGIPEEDMQRVLKRFVRLDRSRLTPGHGLGLSFVGSVAALHAGSLELESARPGLRAIVLVSRAADASARSNRSWPPVIPASASPLPFARPS